MRLAALYSHPIQYAVPLFRELAARPDVDLTVYFCSRQGLDVSFDPQFGQAFKWDTLLLDGYRSVFLPNWRSGTASNGFFRLINPAIWQALTSQRYDAILVHGYEHFTKWLTFGAARLTRTPIILRGESHLLSARPWHVRAVKSFVLHFLLRQVSAAVYIGQHNKAYYLHYGLPEARLFFAPYVVDNEFFRRQADLNRSRRAELRARWGVPEQVPVILACGKLYDIKQPLLLLRAYQTVRQEMPCALVFAGDGAMRAEVEEIVRTQQIPDVTITGFVNQSSIGELYALADVLAMPSRHEQWGLAVNEAMNFGLPVIVSDQVGCSPDLVRPGENGYIVDYQDIGAWADALRKLVTDPDRRASFGRRSLEIIGDYSPQRSAKAIVDAARYTQPATRQGQRP